MTTASQQENVRVLQERSEWTERTFRAEVATPPHAVELLFKLDGDIVFAELGHGEHVVDAVSTNRPIAQEKSS